MARTPLRRNELVRLLDAAAAPWYALDGERRIVYLNPGCAAWLAVDPNDLLGLVANYHSQPSGRNDAVAARLAAPPEVYAGQRLRTAIARADEGQPLVYREAEFFPLWRTSGEVDGVLVQVAAVDLPPGEPRTDRPDDPVAADLHRRLAELRAGGGLPSAIDRLVGESPAIRRVRQQVHLASSGDGNVLVVGPAGSGAERIAQSLARARRGSDLDTLVPLSSWLLDARLLQSTVVALTRRLEASTGRAGHTLLMYEIDQLPADAQTELAGLLTHLGSRLQIVATASHSLIDLAHQGKFHDELAHLASTLVIELPPLVERRADVPLLAQLFVEEQNALGGPQRSGFTPAALDRLHSYRWPGDVDELAQMTRESFARATGTHIDVGDLPERIDLAAHAAQFARPTEQSIVLDEFLAEIERELLRRALAQARSNKSKAATLLGISRPRLLRRLKELGLE